MRCPLIAALALALLSSVSAEELADLAFADGSVWLDAKIITKETTYVIVMHGGGIHTIHATQLMPGSASMLKIRPPTEAEIAERAAADERQREQALARKDAADKAEMEARVRGAQIQAERAATPAPPPVVVNEPCSVVYSPRPTRYSTPSITRIQGRVASRLPAGAIVQADGIPSQPFGDFGWVQGMCFIYQSGQLNATTTGTPISGRVVPAGEFRFTDSQGVVHILRAWRFSGIS